MYCKNCGSYMDDNAHFCSACGHDHEIDTTETIKEPINLNPAYEEAKSRLSNQILTWGILSLAFATTFWLSLLGFIFSFVAKSKVKRYVQQFGPVSYRSKVGRDLSTAGFIVGLILTILCSLYFFIFFIAIGAAIMGM